jgi:hypothetical protein
MCLRFPFYIVGQNAVHSISVADATVDPFCSAKVRGQAPDQQVIFGGNGAFDAPPGPRARIHECACILRRTLDVSDTFFIPLS